MPDSLRIIAAETDPQLLTLPWSTPLEAWPASAIVKLPKGISRHIVRFSEMSGRVIAVKETTDAMAQREYEMLGALAKLDVPCVKRVAVVAGRTAQDGTPLRAALITAHLSFSMPYRALFTHALRPETATRLVDALALLLVRLHNVGFYWGDVSLSNTLFRRDAGSFAAYLVDAETGELHEGGLSEGQRDHDLDLARTNIAGELLDLAAHGRVEGVDPVAVADGIVAAYRSLWGALHDEQTFSSREAWRITERVRLLNDLGFDIDEMSIETEGGGSRVSIQPKVVDAGHHARRLIRLTGLDVEENQARRLLNDLDEFRLHTGRSEDEEELAAHEWLTQAFEPVVRAIPYELRAKLEPAEVYHEVLEHRWFLQEQRDASVPLAEVLSSYMGNVLRHRRDEATIMGPLTETITASLPQSPEVDWRDLV